MYAYDKSLFVQAPNWGFGDWRPSRLGECVHAAGWAGVRHGWRLCALGATRYVIQGTGGMAGVPVTPGSDRDGYGS